jgi:tetratricopeptide (TPR) repeat protein
MRVIARIGFVSVPMKIGVNQGLFIVASLLLLTGCETTSTNETADLKAEATSTSSGDIAAAPKSDETTGTVVAPAPTAAPQPPVSPPITGSAELLPTSKALLGSDEYDDLSMGKRFFRDNNFGLAERHFRRAAESHPRDAEAWLGLAAAYDRLKRFDLADRAYAQVLRITGPTPEVLNNIGYSYMLRGDYKRARQKLEEAQTKDPDNPFVRTNLDLLAESKLSRKAIR